jgi:PucR C-terminal helix-turn-helix domain/GGDEF-like domain
MSVGKRRSQAADQRVAIAAGLAAKRPEIERIANDAIGRVEPPVPVDSQSEYEHGIARAVQGVLDYVLASLAAGSTAVEPVPLVALDQARRAAKAGVGIDTVLRRYAAGDRALRRALAAELTGRDRSIGDDVHTLAEEAVDRVMRDAAAEFDAETTRLSEMADPRLVMTLGLLHEEIRVTELDGYVLDRWHIGLVTESAVPKVGLLRLAESLGGQPLLVDSRRGQRWAWIGKSEPMAAARVEAALMGAFQHRAAFGLGEPRRGLSGWRLTHTEARIAAELPDNGGRPVTRLRDHVLEAAVLGGNRVFAECLLATYVEPLEREASKSVVDLHRTVCAYLRSGQNAKSAAQHLGIDRHTVLRRVRKVEELVGEKVEDCFAQLDTALRIATISDDPFRR